MFDQSFIAGLKSPIIVSACLLGIECRYDLKKSSGIRFKIPKGVCLIPVCPEQLGGLPTPRPKSWFVNGDGKDVLEGNAIIVNEFGLDVTHNFIRGAEAVKRIACLVNARSAILKDKSPSCGTCHVTISGKLSEGFGVTAKTLNGLGICIVNELGRSAKGEE